MSDHPVIDPSGAADCSDSGFYSSFGHKGIDTLINTSYTDFSIIYSSPSGFCRLVRAKRMGRWVVLKCLKEEYREHPGAMSQIVKEFEIGYLMDHPWVVRTLGLEQVDGYGLCVVMEWIDGVTLKSLIKGRSLSRQQALRILEQLSAAIDHIHSRQVTHRDIKPENIMVTRQGGDVKIIDFGFSDSPSHAILKQPAGTMRYIAPEQLTASDATGVVDGRADIYSLGRVVAEINSALPHRSRRLRHLAAWCSSSAPERRPAHAGDIRWRTSPRTIIIAAAATGAAVCVAAVVATVLLIDRSQAPTAASAPTAAPAMAEAASDSAAVSVRVDTVERRVTDTVYSELPADQARERFLASLDHEIAVITEDELNKFYRKLASTHNLGSQEEVVKLIFHSDIPGVVTDRVLALIDRNVAADDPQLYTIRSSAKNNVFIAYGEIAERTNYADIVGGEYRRLLMELDTTATAR